ncbi:MAG: hypothetical protein GAK45_00257 [Pseudomonas citronellolis]|nr:MAG: hypothetical protein GAK45_00257 [Pseudomonas citronellolis]
MQPIDHDWTGGMQGGMVATLVVLALIIALVLLQRRSRGALGTYLKAPAGLSRGVLLLILLAELARSFTPWAALVVFAVLLTGLVWQPLRERRQTQQAASPEATSVRLPGMPLAVGARPGVAARVRPDDISWLFLGEMVESQSVVGLSAPYLSRRFNLSANAVKTHLKKLIGDGYISVSPVRMGNDERYLLTQKGLSAVRSRRAMR